MVAKRVQAGVKRGLSGCLVEGKGVEWRKME